MSRSARTTLTLVACLLLVPTLAFALPVRVGVSLGPSMSTLSGANVDWARSIAGGPEVGVSLDGAFEIRAGAFVVVRGCSYGASDLTDPNGIVLGTYDSRVAATQIEVPVTACWSPPLVARVRPFLLAGPFVSMEIAETYHTTGAQSVLPAKTDTRIVPNNDFGLVIGAGLSAPFGPGRVSLTARYDAGLKNVNAGGPAMHSRFATLMLGYGR